jgi:hypothetical protein
METHRCSIMGALVSRGRGVLEDSRSHPRSRIWIGPQSDPRTRHSSELSPAAYSRGRRKQRHKTSKDSDSDGD